MKTPYSHVHTLANVVFAARGGAIHSFNVVNGSHISTWKHPDVAKQVAAAAQATEDTKTVEDVKEDIDMGVALEVSDEPPAKRQRTSENGDAQAAGEAKAESGDAQDPQEGGKKKGKKSKNRSKGEGSYRLPQAPEKPLVVLITSTEGGKYAIAVTGHDKTIWVFEHDGEGNLKELSQRKMPKRPIDLAIGPDNTIIAADKFGDVYTLPLLFDPTAPVAKSISTAPPAPKAKPSATTLTVHSKRNRIALEAQLQMYEAQKTNGGNKEATDPDAPTFEMDLVLGHVSMLTAVELVESEGRRYILTADRDEHIRVSRYVPQAHVIECFCLGHKEFISSMVVPAGRDDILVSGGGDNDLFVWDWKTGAKLSTANVLSLAQVVAPEVTKVAVSSLATLLYPTENGVLSYVLAICEDIKAIFAWQLTEDNKLNHPSVIQLPGHPLHLTVAPQSASPSSPPRLIIAIDPQSDVEAAKSLNIFTLTMNEGRLSSDQISSVDDEPLSAAELELTKKEIRALLYTTEQLRKQEYIAGDDEEEVQEGEVVAAVSAEPEAE